VTAPRPLGLENPPRPTTTRTMLFRAHSPSPPGLVDSPRAATPDDNRSASEQDDNGVKAGGDRTAARMDAPAKAGRAKVKGPSTAVRGHK
jgi:hypothetical protein